MKKASAKKNDSDLRPEYDLSQLQGGVRGKYYQQANAGTNLVLIEPELADVFPDTESVNSALRLLADTTVGDTSIDTQDTSNFSAEEKANVRESISQFRASVLTNFDPSPDQLEFIDQKLNYLSQAADRFNHSHWRVLAISTVMGIATNLSTVTASGRLLIRLFQEAFRTGVKLLQ